jgi:ribosome-associated protein
MTKQTPEALRLALDAIQDLKANELVVLDLRGLTDATDYFVIASGTSDAHVRGIVKPNDFYRLREATAESQT